MNSHRIQQVGPLLTPKATYEDPLSGGPRSGASLAFFLAGLWTKFPAAHYELERVTGDQDRLAIEWTATGFSRATNKPPLNGVFVIQLQDDAISSVSGYFDASNLR